MPAGLRPLVGDWIEIRPSPAWLDGSGQATVTRVDGDDIAIVWGLHVGDLEGDYDVWFKTQRIEKILGNARDYAQQGLDDANVRPLTRPSGE